METFKVLYGIYEDLSEYEESLPKIGIIKVINRVGEIGYYKNGKLHNETGPAIINMRDKFYWLNGKFIGGNFPSYGKPNIISDDFWIKYQKLMVFQ